MFLCVLILRAQVTCYPLIMVLRDNFPAVRSTTSCAVNKHIIPNGACDLHAHRRGSEKNEPPQRVWGSEPCLTHIGGKNVCWASPWLATWPWLSMPSSIAGTGGRSWSSPRPCPNVKDVPWNSCVALCQMPKCQTIVSGETWQNKLFVVSRCWTWGRCQQFVKSFLQHTCVIFFG